MQDSHHRTDDVEATAEKRVDRRGMLRKASFFAATAAGAAVAGAVAPPAQAAPGDPVLQGSDNNAGSSATKLRNASGTNPTLVVQNTGVDSFGRGGPALTIPPSTAYEISEQAPVGSMMLARDGMVRIAPPDESGNPIHNHYLYDSYNSNFIVPVIPFRAVDTRFADQRTALFGTSGALDSSGRLIAGKTVHLNLSNMIPFTWAVFFNLSAVTPTNAGVLRVWPYGEPQPNATALNYQKGVSITNGTLSAVGWDDYAGITDALSIWTNATTHFVIDITAVVINHWASFYQASVTPMVAAPGVAAASSERSKSLARRQKAFAEHIAKWAAQR